MHDLEIVWPSGKSTFTVEDSPILVGRSSKADIVLSQGSVSRRHLEIVWDSNSWTVSDPSTHGTFDPIGVKLAKTWAVNENAVVRVGGTEGVELNFSLVDAPQGTLNKSAGSWDDIPIDNADSTTPEPGENSNSNQFDQSSLDSGGDLNQRDPKLVPQARPGQHFTDVAPSHTNPTSPVHQTVSRRVDNAISTEPQSVSSGYNDANFRSQPPPVNGQQTSRQTPSNQTPSRQTPSNEVQSNQFQSDQTQQRNYSANGSVLGPLDPSPGQPVQRSTSGGSLFDEPPAQTSAKGPPLFDDRTALPSGQPSLSGSVLDAPSETGRVPIPALGPDHSAKPTSTQTNASESILRLSVDGQDYSFSPGTEITIGRDPSCTVHLDERHSLVSRRHLRIGHERGSWWLEDHSSKGTFVDDRQLKGGYEAQGAFIALLGDRDTGTQVRIITSGAHVGPKQRRSRWPAVIALIALVAIAAAVAFFLLSRGANNQAAAADPTSAQTSTLMVLTIEDGKVASHSSGFMVTDDLLVTTRSVTDGVTPSLVGVVDQAGEPASVTYATSWVASHPYLDLSVLRVATSTRETDGGYVMAAGIDGDISLPMLGLSDSLPSDQGGDIFVAGFPASPSITSTERGLLMLPTSASINGSVDSFRMWPGCDTTGWQDLLPAQPGGGSDCSNVGNIEQAVVTLNMPVGSTGPGSPVVQDGKVVAVVLGQDAEDPAVVHAIASESFADWLADITEANS